MSTTVRLIAEVEITVDTWDSQSTMESLAPQAVREGMQKLASVDDVRLIGVKEVRFVTHGLKWDTRAANKHASHE